MSRNIIIQDWNIKVAYFFASIWPIIRVALTFSYLKTLSVPWIKKQLKLLADRKIVLCLEERPGNIEVYIINPEVSEWKAKRPYNKKTAVV